MKDVQKLLRTIISYIRVPEGRQTVKEGVVIYRFGKHRIVRLKNPSAWCATLNTWDRPPAVISAVGKVYNGSSYVDCMVSINTSGEVRVQNFFGSEIAGAQYGYLRPTTLSYFVE